MEPSQLKISIYSFSEPSREFCDPRLFSGQQNPSACAYFIPALTPKNKSYALPQQTRKLFSSDDQKCPLQGRLAGDSRSIHWGQPLDTLVTRALRMAREKDGLRGSHSASDLEESKTRNRSARAGSLFTELRSRRVATPTSSRARFYPQTVLPDAARALTVTLSARSKRSAPPNARFTSHLCAPDGLELPRLLEKGALFSKPFHVRNSEVIRLRRSTSSSTRRHRKNSKWRGVNANRGRGKYHRKIYPMFTNAHHRLRQHVATDL